MKIWIQLITTRTDRGAPAGRWGWTAYRVLGRTKKPTRWGKIVALVGAEVVAAADTMTGLGEKLRSMALVKRPLVFRVAQ